MLFRSTGCSVPEKSIPKSLYRATRPAVEKAIDSWAQLNIIWATNDLIPRVIEKVHLSTEKDIPTNVWQIVLGLQQKIRYCVWHIATPGMLNVRRELITVSVEDLKSIPPCGREYWKQSVSRIVINFDWESESGSGSDD